MVIVDALPGLLLWAVGMAVLYWVIRLGVRHAIEDAELRRHLRGDE